MSNKKLDLWMNEYHEIGVKIQYPSSWGVQTGANVFDENGNLVQPIDIADIAPPIQSDPNAVAYFQIGVEQQLTPADTKNIDLYLRGIINGYRFRIHIFFSYSIRYKKSVFCNVKLSLNY